MANTAHVLLVDTWPQPVYHPNDQYRVVAYKSRSKADVVQLDEEQTASAEETGWAVPVGNQKPETVQAKVRSGEIRFVQKGPEGIQVEPAPRFHQTAVSAALPENQTLDVPEEVGGPNVKPGQQASQS